MLSLYEILKASKTGIAPDMWTALAGANFGGVGSGAEVKEITGIPPLSFTANGQPLLDYLISGNMSQSGTPTPTTPIQPSECGERTGNLFDSDTVYSAYKQSDGTYLGNVNNFYTTHVKPFTSGDIGKTFTFTMVVKATTSTNVRASANINGTAINGNNLSAAGTTTVTFTVSSVNDYLYLGYGGGGANPITLDNIMLNSGSSALPYEPYGYKIPISSASTTTPVYLGEVETTRKIKKLVLTGEEIILRDRKREGSWRFFTDKLISAEGNAAICSHFENIGAYDVNDSDNIGFSIFNNAQFGCRCPETIAATASDFKAYLAAQYTAGTPVTVWYVLAEPTTGIVNEPLHKIGKYADTLSMKQAGVSIPTSNGSTTIDVNTTLKPSEIYIKYKGV